MTKTELINAIAEQGNLSKADAGRSLDALIKTIETTLKAGNSITLSGRPRRSVGGARPCA
jgi:DNA-binding protein HU-beta